MITLHMSELHARAARLKLVLTDNDGTLTDATTYYSAHGEALKKYSLRDGMGVELLRAAGVETVIITREQSEIVARRAEKLGIACLLGLRDKRAYLEQTYLPERGLSAFEVAYIGDDVNDLEAMQLIAPAGLTGAPVDAMPCIHEVAHFIAPVAGGNGAFRAFAEWLLALRRNTK